MDTTNRLAHEYLELLKRWERTKEQIDYLEEENQKIADLDGEPGLAKKALDLEAKLADRQAKYDELNGRFCDLAEMVKVKNEEITVREQRIALLVAAAKQSLAFMTGESSEYSDEIAASLRLALRVAGLDGGGDFKVICDSCGWEGWGSERPEAENPFDPDETIWGCPTCKGIDCFNHACDEPGCWRLVTCGTPTPDGYRQTCSDHRPEVDSEEISLSEEAENAGPSDLPPPG